MAWHGSRHRVATGRYRYTESSFDVNELVAGLGVITQAADATGAPIKMLVPFNEQTLNEAYFEANGWSDFDKRSWHDLLKNPSVLLSDSAHFTSGVVVQPVVFPPRMQYQVAVAAPTYNGWANQWSTPQAYAIAQPVPQAYNGMNRNPGYGTMAQPLVNNGY